jgi:hypothetical protein
MSSSAQAFIRLSHVVLKYKELTIKNLETLQGHIV